VVAALLAGSVLLSRVLGYGREMVLAYHLGATPEADAYRAAFQIPDILFHFLSGGAFAVAFVPFYTRARERRGPEAARRLLATVFGTMTLIAVAAAALLWIWAEPLVALQFPRFAPETRELTTRLTRIVLPAQIFFVAGGVLRAALMANDRFWTQAVAPLVIIAGGLGLGAVLGAEGFAWGALVGAVLGPFLLPLLDLGRAGLRLGFRFAPWEREFLAYLWRAAPLIVGVSLLTVDEWYDRWFGQLVGDGVVAQLGYARQLMLAPVAVVGQAVATAALPALSQLWSEGRREDLDRALLTTLRASLGLAVVLGAGAFAVAEPAVALLFERGRFTPEDSARVAALLRVFAFAVPGWVTLHAAGDGGGAGGGPSLPDPGPELRSRGDRGRRGPGHERQRRAAAPPPARSPRGAPARAPARHPAAGGARGRARRRCRDARGEGGGRAPGRRAGWRLRLWNRRASRGLAPWR
jgi:putative peptidoglycan lipid II flippase